MPLVLNSLFWFEIKKQKAWAGGPGLRRVYLPPAAAPGPGIYSWNTSDSKELLQQDSTRLYGQKSQQVFRIMTCGSQKAVVKHAKTLLNNII